jgi:hypothetical protein
VFGASIVTASADAGFCCVSVLRRRFFRRELHYTRLHPTRYRRSCSKAMMAPSRACAFAAIAFPPTASNPARTSAILAWCGAGRGGDWRAFDSSLGRAKAITPDQRLDPAPHPVLDQAPTPPFISRCLCAQVRWAHGTRSRMQRARLSKSACALSQTGWVCAGP